MYYVVKNLDNDKFTTPSGSEHSYTKNLLEAAFYHTQEGARRQGVCGNEVIVPLEQLVFFGD